MKGIINFDNLGNFSLTLNIVDINMNLRSMLWYIEVENFMKPLLKILIDYELACVFLKIDL